MTAAPSPRELGGLAELLAASDVDGLRLRLQERRKEGLHTADTSSRAEGGPAADDAPSVHVDTSLLSQHAVSYAVCSPEGTTHYFQLVDVRVMGKICWPAAEALAAHLLEHGKPSVSHPAGGPRILVELGAGCALPSVAAAKTGAFDRVLATDFSPDRVNIAARNAELNGVAVTCMTAAFADEARLSSAVRGATGGCTVVAADVHYNADALIQLIDTVKAILAQRASRFAHALGASATEQWARAATVSGVGVVGTDGPVAAGCVDELILARSANFEFNDEVMHRRAEEVGLVVTSRRDIYASGVLHSVSSTLYDTNVPCPAALYTLRLRAFR